MDGGRAVCFGERSIYRCTVISKRVSNKNPTYFEVKTADCFRRVSIGVRGGASSETSGPVRRGALGCVLRCLASRMPREKHDGFATQNTGVARAMLWVTERERRRQRCITEGIGACIALLYVTYATRIHRSSVTQNIRARDAMLWVTHVACAWRPSVTQNIGVRSAMLYVDRKSVV